MTFIEALNQRAPLVADGATGTMLQAAGLSVGEAPERWTLEKPQPIADIARRYAEAGSDIVYTNTFGGNRVRLKLIGLESKLEEVNRRAVQITREAVSACGRQVFVAASVGPTGEMLEPYGDLSPDVARAVFAEQAAVLQAASVDVIVCESFQDLGELLLCLEAVKSVAKVPVVASMTFEQAGRTMMGVTPEDAVAKLSDAGAVVVGVNCSVGPDEVERAIAAMHKTRPAARLLAKANAGLPQMIGGKTVYSVTPERMAVFALRVKDLGAAIIGGCCGTTPDHIAAIAKALRG
jgi:5-methyltetrahydrofolate--homocysteine methyltransferase